MNRVNRGTRRSADVDLQQVIEPLASYILAADRPRAILEQVYSALFLEVKEMSRIARAHVANRTSNGITRF